jgi:hypothetical protein
LVAVDSIGDASNPFVSAAGSSDQIDMTKLSFALTEGQTVPGDHDHFKRFFTHTGSGNTRRLLPNDMGQRYEES